MSQKGTFMCIPSLLQWLARKIFHSEKDSKKSPKWLSVCVHGIICLVSVLGAISYT